MTERQLVNEQWWQQIRWSANPGTRAVGGLILAIATLLVVIALWITQQHSQVEVPSMVGMSRVKAEALLKTAGLKLQATSDEVSDQPAGTVLRTDPGAGMPLTEGAGVRLVLAIPSPAPAASGNAEPPAVEAPPHEAAAVAPPEPVVEQVPIVEKAPVIVPPAVVAPPPAVVAPPPVVVPPPVQAPPPAQSAPAPPQGPALRPVPDVVGLDRGPAARVLADNRLWVGLVTEEESGWPAGTVLRTNPRAGAAVAPGSAVDLVIAKRSQVVVPNVTGLDRWRAARVLTDGKLSVGSVTEQDSNSPPGTVLWTNPRAGTAVWRGSSVDLVIAKQREIVVPDVVGKDRAQAARVLADHGLSVGSVTEQESSKPAGTVLETDPTAGTAVSPGKAVNLVVAKAPVSKGEPPTKPPTNGSGTDDDATKTPGVGRNHRDG